MSGNCSTCKHWYPSEVNFEFNVCHKISAESFFEARLSLSKRLEVDKAFVGHEDLYAELTTKADFGCTLHESKEEKQ